MRKNLFKWIIYCIFVLPHTIYAETAIYQTGTLVNLMNGVYNGSISFSELAKKGSLGLGTGNNLNGEMVEIDNQFYVADARGNAHKISLQQKTPFAMVTKFIPQQHFVLHNIKNLAQLENSIDSHLASKNLFYVIKVDGTFDYIKARSIIPPQKPYKTLATVIKSNQRIFYFYNLQGSLVIFKSPDFINPTSVPGYHVHFISKNRKKAGHVFDASIKNAKISVEQVNQFILILPTNAEYTQTNFSPVTSTAITNIENKH